MPSCPKSNKAIIIFFARKLIILHTVITDSIQASALVRAVSPPVAKQTGTDIGSSTDTSGRVTTRATKSSV